MISPLRYRISWCLTIAATLVLAGCPSQEQIARDFQANRIRSYTQLCRQSTPDPNSDLPVIGGPLTLDDCVELAMKHNKDVQTARVGLIDARGRMTEAVSTAMPKASATGSALLNDNTFTIAGKESYDVGLQLRQPLYLGGLAGAALDAASVYTYMVGQQFRQAQQNAELLVRRDFLKALLDAELVKVAVKAKADAQEHLVDIEKKLKFGVGTRFDLLRAQVRVTAVDAELIRTRNDARLAVSNLLNGMGVSQLSQIELIGVLAYEPLPIDQQASFAAAITSRAALLIGEAMIRLADNNIKAEQSGDRPKLYLQGDYRRLYPGSAFLGGRDWERAMSAGLVMEWPFFDGLQTAGRVTQARAELQRQQVAQRKLELQVQYEVTQALVTLENSQKFVMSQQGNVDNGAEALRLSQVSFREGAGTSLDVISAELALSQARSDFITAVYAYQLSQLGLHAAIGTIGEEPLPSLPQDANDLTDNMPEDSSP